MSSSITTIASRRYLNATFHLFLGLALISAIGMGAFASEVRQWWGVDWSVAELSVWLFSLCCSILGICMWHLVVLHHLPEKMISSRWMHATLLLFVHQIGLFILLSFANRYNRTLADRIDALTLEADKQPWVASRAAVNILQVFSMVEMTMICVTAGTVQWLRIAALKEKAEFEAVQ